jgi:tetratricopeptide (TPR) repeat protein
LTAAARASRRPPREAREARHGAGRFDLRGLVVHPARLAPVLGILLALAFGPLRPGAALAQPAASASAAPSAGASASPRAGQAPLPELPKLPPITLPEPDPGATQDLTRLLERLTADDERTRTNARTAVAEATPSMVPAIRQRVQELRGPLDRDAVPKILEEARKSGRKAMKDKGKSKSKSKDKDDEDGDWLDFVLAAPRPKDKAWRDLVHLLAMERMLAAVGTTPAVREMIQYHAYFGDLFRIDLQRQVLKLKDKAVPALIEARQHDAKIVQRWANRQLDALGRAIPGEAVASSDPQVLADVLRAYGRTRDVDAERVILSFCNSDRIQLREAAREAIAAIGEPGMWQLRDVYLGLTGNKPPREWAWDRLARELFALYDRARLAEVYKLMDDGVAASGEKKYAEATQAFDKVLARAPLFDRRREMVPAYVARSREIAATSRQDGLEMLRKALRLDPKGPDAKAIDAEIAYLEGMVLIDRGTPDKFILQRALELDPGHERARLALQSLEDRAVVRQTSLRRYAAAGGIGVAALIAMLLLARRRGPLPAAPREAPPTPPQ